MNEIYDATFNSIIGRLMGEDNDSRRNSFSDTKRAHKVNGFIAIASMGQKMINIDSRKPLYNGKARIEIGGQTGKGKAAISKIGKTELWVDIKHALGINGVNDTIATVGKVRNGGTGANIPALVAFTYIINGRVKNPTKYSQSTLTGELEILDESKNKVVTLIWENGVIIDATIFKELYKDSDDDQVDFDGLDMKVPTMGVSWDDENF